MRAYGSRFLTLFAALAAASPALAADSKDRPVPEAGAVQVVLLRHKSVCDELRLGEAQCKKVEAFAKKQWDKAKQVAEASEDEQNRRFQAMERENERFLDEMLSPAQHKRLDQITIQVAGLLWLSRDEIARDLNLTTEQQAKVKQLQAEAKREMQEALHANDSGDKHARFKELRNTNRKRLLDLLNDEQEATWKQLAGPTFNGDLGFER
jgi:Spy/CpxP family protein refolding chaperone